MAAEHGLSEPTPKQLEEHAWVDVPVAANQTAKRSHNATEEA